MIIKSWSEIGLDLSGKTGQVKTKCICSKDRVKNPEEECLSINLDLQLGHCHHCQETFIIDGVTRNPAPTYRQRQFEIPKYTPTELTGETIEYFAGRGIGKSTLELNNIGNFTGNNTGEIWATFPYCKDIVVNVGMRKLSDKTFKFSKGCELCFYGMQNLLTGDYVNTKKVIITEGQIDALSFYECGLTNTISVPNGSPFTEGQKTEPKLEYLEDPFFLEIAENIDEFIIATDTDYAGRRLAQALSDRLGAEKCSRMDFNGFKDVNELLVANGEKAVLEAYLARKPMLQGIVTNVNDRMLQFYSTGLQRGLDCGIKSMDEIFSLGFGYITLVTGIPEVGKSLFLDNLLVGYAEKYGIHSTIFSPETKPLEFHVSRLITIKTGQYVGSPDDFDRISYREYTQAVSWVDEHFTFLEPKNNTLEEIVRLFKASILKNGSKICVIDPFSRIKIDGDNERMFIRSMLNELSEFVLHHKIHLFIIAHPTKTETVRTKKDKPDELLDTPIITPYQIKGAGEWYDSADFVISLWRTVQYPGAPLRAYVLKSKLHHLAQSNVYASMELRNFKLRT